MAKAKIGIKGRSNREGGRAALGITFRPLQPALWSDLEELFGERGACGGCWCMWWRLRRAEFEMSKGNKNRRAFQRIVKSGQVPGILAYIKGKPAGWCAIEPRENYEVLARSKSLKAIDAQAVWSVVCFFVPTKWRGRGIGTGLLEAAARWAKKNGAKIVEGYPVEPKMKIVPGAFAWTGVPALFRGAGFREVARPSPSRVVMRRMLN